MKKKKTNHKEKRLFNLTTVLLIGILLLASVLRLWGIQFALPNKVIIDENDLIYWAFYAASSALRPIYYLYAPLVPLILIVEFGFYFLAGRVFGKFDTPLQFFASFLSDPTPFFLLGRITIAFAGIVTVWFVWKIGNEFFNKRIGLIAAFLIAIFFLHVKESHYIKQDVLSGLFITICFYYLLLLVRMPTFKSYFFAGLAFGLAIATKYPTALIFPVILFAHFKSFQTKNINKLMFLIIVSAITFLCIHPYFVIEPLQTIQRTLHDASQLQGVYPEHLQGKTVAMWFFTEHIPQGISYPAFIAAFVGFVICFFSHKKLQYLFVPILPLIFFATVDIWTKIHYARYAIIILPYFALSCAICIDWISQLLKKVRYSSRIILGLLILVSFQNIQRSVIFDTIITKPDTRFNAKDWIEKNISKDTKIVVESALKPEYPSYLSVPLILSQKRIDERIVQAKEHGKPGYYLQAFKIAQKNAKGFDVIGTSIISQRLDVLTSKATNLKDVSWYVDNKINYIIKSSWMDAKFEKGFLDSLRQHYFILKTFTPTYTMQWDPHFVRVDYQALDLVLPLRSDIVFGPVIEIYERKK